MPYLTIAARDETGEVTCEIQKEQTIFEKLLELGAAMPQNCGGARLCGKCKIRFLTAAPAVTPEETALPWEELSHGVRLACCHSIAEDTKIALIGAMQLFNNESNRKMAGAKMPFSDEREKPHYQVAVDVGTTTLAAAFLPKRESRIERVLTGKNNQSCYGSDVISRIRFANEGGGARLQEIIWEDIFHLIAVFCGEKGVDITVDEIVVSANTAMNHFLLGYSTTSLGEAPFLPVSLELEHRRLKDIYPDCGDRSGTEVTILPGMGAFVGADIVSGLYATAQSRKGQPVLFVDLGTNGEMVLFTGSEFVGAATAAGPAFEGASIKDGMPGICGALCGINMLGKTVQLHTIGDGALEGICGTGVLELVYELRKMGLVDKHGTFVDNLREKGFFVGKRKDGSEVYFTQEDVRQFQMAKAAIRSGIEVLLWQCGMTAHDVTEVCLAGGFGYKLNAHKAVGVGLLPQALEKRTRAVGNTSLDGACQYALRSRNGGRTEQERQLSLLVERAKVINFAGQPEFQECYIRNMDF